MAEIEKNASPPDVTGLTILDTRREVVELASLWQDRRIVLVFLRHFG